MSDRVSRRSRLTPVLRHHRSAIDKHSGTIAPANGETPAEIGVKLAASLFNSHFPWVPIA